MQLKAPYPYFGGKSKIAARVWELLGKCHRYIEPFFGSGAVLLARPDWRPGDTNEIVNDFDCMIANFWRAVKSDPDGVAEWADWPVNHADLAARRAYCLAHKPDVLAHTVADPEWCDSKIAGYWVWGMSCAIAGCFMDEGQNERSRKSLATNGAIPELVGMRGTLSAGIATAEYAGGVPESGDARDDASGNPGGVHSAVPSLRDVCGVASGNPNGVKFGIPSLRYTGGVASGNQFGLSTQIPFLDHSQGVTTASHAIPSLTANQGCQTGYAASAEGGIGGVRAWMYALRDRFRNVKVVCGDWSRVLGGNWQGSGGPCGIFLDPPYGGDTKHSVVYAHDSTTVAGKVTQWCLERGNDPNLRIVLAGYDCEHDALLEKGWRKEAWKANGGYGNQRKDGTNDNCEKERLWISPACGGKRSQSLF